MGALREITSWHTSAICVQQPTPPLDRDLCTATPRQLWNAGCCTAADLQHAMLGVRGAFWCGWCVGVFVGGNSTHSRALGFPCCLVFILAARSVAHRFYSIMVLRHALCVAYTIQYIRFCHEHGIHSGNRSYSAPPRPALERRWGR